MFVALVALRADLRVAMSARYVTRPLWIAYFTRADICASATSVLCNSGREGGEEYVQCAARLSRMSSKPTDLNKLSNGCSVSQPTPSKHS